MKGATAARAIFISDIASRARANTRGKQDAKLNRYLRVNREQTCFSELNARNVDGAADASRLTVESISRAIPTIYPRVDEAAEAAKRPR